MKILLAEDDKNFRMVLQRELEEEGWVVLSVNNGAEAVLRVIEDPYDFAVLDLNMPRLHGLDALRMIKKIRPGVHVVTISGNAGLDDIRDSLNAGAVQCFSKPFSIDRLKECIRGCA